ncbi:hypothetical protein [Halorhodospira neutriphila]|mgnify:CR=1 FL=1|nr:hypothetical protein [Halorhodospira neutriphila]
MSPQAHIFIELLIIGGVLAIGVRELIVTRRDLRRIRQRRDAEQGGGNDG